MSINYYAVAIATVAEFVIGAIWYMPIFGKLWGKIHGFDKLTKAERQSSQNRMMPLLIVQLLMTVITTLVLARLIVTLPSYSVYLLALLAWIGFVVPTQISAVIFGGTEPKWILTKTVIMAGGSLACLMAAAAILKNVTF